MSASETFVQCGCCLPFLGFANIVQFNVFECCVCSHFFCRIDFGSTDVILTRNQNSVELYTANDSRHKNKVHQTRVKFSRKHFTSNTLRCELKNSINFYFCVIKIRIQGEMRKVVAFIRY